MKKKIMDSAANNEREFAYKVRRALDERTTDLPSHITDRLSLARKMAIARKKPESAVFLAAPLAPRFAGHLPKGFNHPLNDSFNWLRRVGLLIPIIVLIVGSIGIYQYEQERRIDELAELDAAVLGDELPLNAFLDHGFNSYLNKHGE